MVHFLCHWEHVFLVVFGAVGAKKMDFWRRRRRKFGFGGGFGAISSRKMCQNVSEKHCLQADFGFFEFPREDFDGFP